MQERWNCENSLLMPMKYNMIKNIKIFLLAFTLTVIFIQFSRFISPTAIINNCYIFLAWMPLCVMLGVICLFGKRAILPVFIGMFITNQYNFNLPLPQSIAVIICQTLAPFACCAILRWQLGPRWRFGLTKHNVWARIFWFGFVAPVGIKTCMFIAGDIFAFPVAISTFFDNTDPIFTVVDMLSLIGAVLIFNMFFYYLMRMVVNPHYARALWCRDIAPALHRRNRLFTLTWLTAVSSLLIIMRSPYENGYIAGYLVPVFFIIFNMGVGRLKYPFLNIVWAISVLFLLGYNRNFLHGVVSEYSLAFILSVLISFSICLLYMVRIFQRSEWLKRRWHLQALTDPLTNLPNLRALEQFVQHETGVSICCLRLDNLEFLSRHYGIQMRVYSKRIVYRALLPLLHEQEKVFQLPGSELLLVLKGSEIKARLQHMVDVLSSRKIYWSNTGLDIEYGASWGVYDGNPETLPTLLGQLSWLAEQAHVNRCVMGITDNHEAGSGQITESVLLLHKVRIALERGDILLHAQPIRDARGEGYDEILTRLKSDDGIITPDKFIPLIAQFNLSARFDLLVVESLLRWIATHPTDKTGPRFSVNLMPLTLLQPEIAARIVRLFKRYNISPETVIIEITEEQAFSNAEISMHNIELLHNSGFKIAIDDFGTGYANYERLKRLNAEIIKIDGVFIREIMTDSLDKMIVKSITDLAKAKSLSVVAEFVETEEQKELLFSLGVNYLQGYLIGKPQPLGK